MIGFIGLGLMGQPMALNMVRAGKPLVVWNRSRERSTPLAKEGATVVQTPQEVFNRADIVILMLASSSVTDAVLERTSRNFETNVKDHVFIQMATTSAEYSLALESDISAAGGRYIEAPVSGSRIPAETGRLVGMLAGNINVIKQVRPLLQPICHHTLVCGSVPQAMHTKLAINLFMINMITGLSEAVQFAQANGLDMRKFRAALDAGPMASELSRIKLQKLVDRDFSVQATIANVLENCQLVAQAARSAGLASPLLEVSHALFQETLDLGDAQLDMAAVIHALEVRTQAKVPL